MTETAEFNPRDPIFGISWSISRFIAKTWGRSHFSTAAYAFQSSGQRS